jgi:hypothetical protein|nr:MAG TPA: hypothetical protein [Caudoviricetes sp.]
MTITVYNARVALRMQSGDFFIWDEVTHLIIDNDTLKIKMRNKRESGKFPVSLIRNCEIYY